MSLTTTLRNRLIDSINVAFDAIGVDPPTKMPRLKKADNRSPAAWEYFIASHIASRARKRLDVAKAHAIEAGVIFDPTKAPRTEGTNEQVFSGEHVSIWLTVRTAATRVDVDKLCDYLTKNGVKTELVAKAYNQAKYKSSPAHEFKVSLVANDAHV